MTEALPWSFKGIDRETRIAARAAAERSGKSLSDWLDDVIHEKAASHMRGTKLTEVDDDLAEPSPRRPARAPRGYGRPERERGRWRRESPPRRDAYDDEPTDNHEDDRDERPRSRYAREAAERDRGLDARTIVDDAVAVFERRASESERKTAKALAGLADLIESGHRTRSRLGDELGTVIERLGRIENRIASRPEETPARPIRSALARLESRIDRISNEDRAADFESALGKLDRRLADIAARLDEEADERRAERARPAPPQPSKPPQREPRPSAAARRPLAEAIAEITERQRALEERSEFTRRPAAPPAQPQQDRETVGAMNEIAASIEAISLQLAAARQEQSVRSEQQAAVASQIDLLRRELDGVSRSLGDLASRDAVIAVEAALQDIAARAQSGAGPQLEGLRRELDGIARSLGELAPRSAVKAIEAAVRDLSARSDQTSIAPQLDLLHRELDGVSRSLGDLAPRSSIKAVEAAVRDLADRSERQAAVAPQVEQLRRELDGVSRALVDLAPRASIDAVEAALRELADRIETQRYFGVQEHLLAPVERLASDLRSVIGELDPSRVLRELQGEVKALGQKLDSRPAAGVVGADSSALGEIAGQTREIHELLKAVALRPLPLEKLETGLSELASRVDALSLPGKSLAPEADIGEKIAAIRKIVATETSGAFAAFERRLEGLAVKIDAVLAKSSGGGKRFDELNERIERVHKSLAARIDRNVVGVGVDISQLEQLVTNLAKKIDTAVDPAVAHPAFDELGRKIEKLEERLPPAPGAGATSDDGERFRDLAERIDFVHSALAQRIEDGARTRSDEAVGQLAALVAQLAQKMDAALDPRADREAFAALEEQIGRLAERLDHSDRGGGSFASMERTIGELLSRVEETRGAATRAAELAARQAAQDALRDAMAPGSLQDALEKELSELRAVQDESGQRTHETLAAVHETLERVVDRLAVFEDELADLRKAPRSAPAPSPAREEAAPRRDARPKPAAAAADVEDILLEPGDRRPRRETEKPAREPQRSGSVQADFIAAARRAAQQAAVDAQSAAAQAKAAKKPAPAAERPVEEPRVAVAGGGSIGSALVARKRPLLLGLGALVLLYGAYTVARVSVDAPGPDLSAARVDPEQPTAAKSGAKEPAAKEPGDLAASEPKTDAAPTTPPAASPAAPAAKEAPRAAAPNSGAPLAQLPSLSDKAPDAGAFVPPPASTPSPSTPSRGAALTVDPTPIGAIPSNASAPAAITPPRVDVLATIRELAAAGDPSAQFELGARYVEGHGLPRDAKTAFRWFEKAAEKGLAPAQYRLGSLYEKGIGVERDFAKARGWYQRAAEAGNARAMHNLAVFYAEGGSGKPDYAAAAEWFRKAAEYGVRDSQYNLAILCARGLGVSQSLTQSYLWFSAAAAQGDADAGKKRDEVKARLDAKDLAGAQALADGFRPKQPERAANDVLPPPGGWENAKAPAKPVAKPAHKAKVSAL